MKTSITLTNNITGQTFDYSLKVNNETQLYNRIKVLMEQLAVIENINPENVSHAINSRLAA